MRWFSSKLRFAVLQEGAGAPYFSDLIVLFRSADFDAGFQRALSLGRGREKEYVGGEGHRVRWRLKEVVSLDVLDDELDGAEVYAESVDARPADALQFDSTFTPEARIPPQTV